MKLVIEIEMDNCAFMRCAEKEVVRIVAGAANRLRLDAPDECKLRDINGNTVGFAHVTDD